MPGNKLNSQISFEQILDNLEKKEAKAQKALNEGKIETAKKVLALSKDEIRAKEDAQKQLQQEEADAAERLQAHIAMLRAQHIDVSVEREKQLVLAAQAEEDNARMQAELNLIKQTSAEAQKERAEKNRQLERELKIAKLRSSGNKEDAKQADKLEKEAKKESKDKENQEIIDKNLDEMKETLFGGFTSMKESLSAKGALAQLTESGNNALKHSLKEVSKAIKEGYNAINKAISSYAEYQTAIETRTYGATNFSELTKDLATVAYSPLLDAEDLYTNLDELVSEGIVTNVAQRAMLMTIKDAVVTTFDVNGPVLRRLIRVQQQDSTAARMGMEAYLNRFLNEFVENTEYLTTTFDNVADKLLEASALMDSDQSAEFEYIVQKWLGTLSGVGLSDTAANDIADAIGKLGSGDTSVFESGVGSLLTMGAARSGISIGDVLNNGLDANTVNDLLYGVVEYISELSSYSSNVVKNELADTFGLTISDLEAVSNLAETELDVLYNNVMSYDDMYKELANQFGQITSREKLETLLENAFNNFTYQTGMSIASNPVLYTTWKITDLIQSVTGGISIPYLTELGTGLDLEATVENLIKTVIIGASTLGNIGNIINGLASVMDGSTLLDVMGITIEGEEVTRGKGLSSYNSSDSTKRANGTTTSSVTYIGNTDSTAYTESIVNEATDEATADVDTAEEEAYNNEPIIKYLTAIVFDETLSNIDTNISSIQTNATLLPGISDNVGAIAVMENTLIHDVNYGVSNIVQAISNVSDVVGIIAENTLGENGSVASLAAISDNQKAIVSLSTQAVKNSNLNYENSSTKTSSVTTASTISNSETTIGTSINESSEDIANYLSDINFAAGFKSIVDNIKTIVDDGVTLKTTGTYASQSLTGIN